MINLDHIALPYRSHDYMKFVKIKRHGNSLVLMMALFKIIKTPK